LQARIAVTRHGEGGNDQRQNGREATDRETGEKGKGEAAHGRKGEDSQGEAIGALEEQGADQGGDQEKGERSPRDSAQNEGIGLIGYRPTLLEDHRHVVEVGEVRLEERLVDPVLSGVEDVIDAHLRGGDPAQGYRMFGI
jgi:hypothetical protein